MLKHKYKHNYNHFWKLNQELIDLIIQISVTIVEIRSNDIGIIIEFYGKSITSSWINQIRKREGCESPEGRPSKEYIEKRKAYIFHGITIIKTATNIGIPIMQYLMSHLNITQTLIKDIQKAQLEANEKVINTKTLNKMIETITAMTLNPAVENFHEADKIDIPFTKMSINYAGSIIKSFEELNNLPFDLEDSFLNLWINLLKLNSANKKIIIYLDGHSKPYYTKETALCGKMSVIEKIMPGTKYLITTIGMGFIISLRNIRVDKSFTDEILKLGGKLKTLLGDALRLFVIDREGCGSDFNKELFEKGIGVITFLRSNQYKSLNDFDYTEIADNHYVGVWKDEEKLKKDDRVFEMVVNNDNLHVMATSYTDENYIDSVFVYKKRWPYCENVIKLLVNHLDFNVNICNGTKLIENPKLESKLPELNRKIVNEQYKIDNQLGKVNIEKRLEKIEKYEKEKTKIEKCPELLVRKTTPDVFVSYVKLSIYNLLSLLFLKFLPKTKKGNTNFEDNLHLIVNRSGSIYESRFELHYIYDCPNCLSDYKILKKFCRMVSKLKLRDDKNRLIRCFVRDDG